MGALSLLAVAAAVATAAAEQQASASIHHVPMRRLQGQVCEMVVHKCWTKCTKAPLKPSLLGIIHPPSTPHPPLMIISDHTPNPGGRRRHRLRHRPEGRRRWGQQQQQGKGPLGGADPAEGRGECLRRPRLVRWTGANKKEGGIH
jgi:hypothetical protein